MIGLAHYIILSAILFVIGMIGVVVNRTNMVSMLMSIELILLACNTAFITFSKMHQNLVGEVFVFYILAIAAIETAIGLAIMVVIYRHHESINTEKLSELKG
ncbi:MAG: NADH-quinone oxidoreductase subunit NuoK [Legionellales bacterium]|nr:NADH-quinone oxidoreductase subunit NuoK [Legionellales bacterium]OUX68252.1 MAG: NADH-quinone oxidoreductase subunit K [bacterium TMED178]|tara:strand:- start:8721 stop:9026 length:306 start_codon:yes stop_codon:yes gene_type:complete